MGESVLRSSFGRAALCAALAGAVTPAAGGDWPQFRGPQRDGASTEEGLLQAWPAGGPRVLWRIALGEGYSAPAVVGSRIYTLFARGDDEFAGCADAATGDAVWSVRLDQKWRDEMGDGPRSTPTVDGEVVYALTSRGKLFALAVADGRQLWLRDLQTEYSAKPPQWGVSTSPLVEGDLLLLDVGGKSGSSVVAFNKKSGAEVWRSQDDKAGYSAPVAFVSGGVRHALFFTGSALVALSPKDGSLLWKVPWKTAWDVNAATPIFIAPDKVFVSSGYDVGGAVYRVTVYGETAKVEEVWKNREMKNKFSSSVLHDGHLYGFDESTLKCVDVAGGTTKWQSRGLGHGTLIYADSHLIVLGDEGTLALVEATPAGHREKGRMKLFDGRTWSMPALAGGRLYIRDQKELVALDVSAPAPKS